MYNMSQILEEEEEKTEKKHIIRKIQKKRNIFLKDSSKLKVLEMKHYNNKKKE